MTTKHFITPMIALIAILGVLSLLLVGGTSSKTVNTSGNSDPISTADALPKTEEIIPDYNETISIDAVNADDTVITTIDADTSPKAILGTLDDDDKRASCMYARGATADSNAASHTASDVIDYDDDRHEGITHSDDAVEGTVSIDAVDASDADDIVITTVIDYEDAGITHSDDAIVSIDAVDASDADDIVITTIDADTSPQAALGLLDGDRHDDDN